MRIDDDAMEKEKNIKYLSCWEIENVKAEIFLYACSKLWNV